MKKIKYNEFDLLVENISSVMKLDLKLIFEANSNVEEVDEYINDAIDEVVEQATETYHSNLIREQIRKVYDAHETHVFVELLFVNSENFEVKIRG